MHHTEASLSLYSDTNEQIHRHLFKLHNNIYKRALEDVRAALVTLHELETKSMDIRSLCREYIGSFEALRDSLESVGRQAATLRTDIIRRNGCSGSCS